MALSIRNPLAEKLAREVAGKSGENITQAIIHSLEDRLEKLKGRRFPADQAVDLFGIARRCAALPDQDKRTADEILGYDADGFY
jgi:antitoxin VapB